MSGHRPYESSLRPNRVSVRLSGDEHALLLAVAEDAGISAARVLRDTFLAEYHPSAAGITRIPEEA